MQEKIKRKVQKTHYENGVDIEDFPADTEYDDDCSCIYCTDLF